MGHWKEDTESQRGENKMDLYFCHRLTKWLQRMKERVNFTCCGQLVATGHTVMYIYTLWCALGVNCIALCPNSR